jgi:hypothetical protein
MNIFPQGDYFFGKNYECIYQECKMNFSNFICPGCFNSLNLKGKYLEGNRVICGTLDCKKSFLNYKCPFCNQIIMDENAEYKFGQTIVCPYRNCRNKFNYLYCVHCRRGIYFKENNYVEGQIITCPFSDCKKTQNFIYCAHCSKGIQYNNGTSNLNKNECECVYPDCKKKFFVKNIHLQVYSNGKSFDFKQGTGFRFVQPTVDHVENLIRNGVLSLTKISLNVNKLADRFEKLGNGDFGINGDGDKRMEIKFEVEAISGINFLICR